MPGYHYKRKGFFYGGNTGIGGHHAGAVAGEGTGAQGPAGGQSSQGNYGGGQNNGQGQGNGMPDPDPQPSAEDIYGISPNLGIAEEAQEAAFSPDKGNGGLSSLSDIMGVVSKISPTMIALRSLASLTDSIEGFFGYEGDPADPPIDNTQGGGGQDILLAQQPLTDFPMQPMDPDQEYLSNITDPQQVRVIQFMEREGIYSPQQIRQYLDATARNVGLG